MGLPVLTAVTGASWEAELVSALGHDDHGVTVVRRCVDLPDLLAAAATGSARAVLLSSDLRRLDRDAVSRLTAAGVAVVGLVDPGDAESDRRLRLLGIVYVLPADSGAAMISAAVIDAVADIEAALTGASRQFGDPGAALPRGPAGTDEAPPGIGAGRLIAVWGPTGAPGRTTVAVGLADELARAGQSTLLIDADVYGGVVALVLGMLEESPGLSAAVRQADNATLDLATLARLCWAVTPSLRVLTGIARADRWPELRPAALEVVLAQARGLCAVTVVDCGFSVEQDEELSFDTLAPRRNAATLTVLTEADTVLCVSGADPVSLQRTVRALAELREVLPEVNVKVVVNRVRKVVVPGDPRREIETALQRFAGVDVLAFLPQDVPAADAALAAGRTLADVSVSSPLRRALLELAMTLNGTPVTGRRRRRS